MRDPIFQLSAKVKRKLQLRTESKPQVLAFRARQVNLLGLEPSCLEGGHICKRTGLSPITCGEGTLLLVAGLSFADASRFAAAGTFT